MSHVMPGSDECYKGGRKKKKKARYSTHLSQLREKTLGVAVVRKDFMKKNA